jgi:hypothetical protein
VLDKIGRAELVDDLGSSRRESFVEQANQDADTGGLGHEDSNLH